MMVRYPFGGVSFPRTGKVCARLLDWIEPLYRLRSTVPHGFAWVESDRRATNSSPSFVAVVVLFQECSCRFAILFFSVSQWVFFSEQRLKRSAFPVVFIRSTMNWP